MRDHRQVRVHQVGDVDDAHHVPSLGKSVPMTTSSIKPSAASKHAPEMRPWWRSSGRGYSPSRPSGSEPNTLKYRRIAASNEGLARAKSRMAVSARA